MTAVEVIDLILASLIWAVIAAGVGWVLALEVCVRLYQRRKRRGHPDEEAAVSRALEKLTFRR